ARLAHVRNLDQLEGGLVHGRLEALVALPVAIGLLDHDAALEEQLLEDQADVELVVARILDAERDVLEIAEQGHALGVVTGSVHGGSWARGKGVAPSRRQPMRASRQPSEIASSRRLQAVTLVPTSATARVPTVDDTTCAKKPKKD